jgi:VWFA-related protein
MKRLIIAAVIVLSAAVSPAQQNLTESIEVRVVNVDVVVRDRAGKPVTGLTKADFELYENGEKREITNLYEVRAAPTHTVPSANKAATPVEPVPAPAEAPVEIRPRNIVMFVDNFSLERFRREKVLQSLLKFVDEQLRPQDHVMLVLCTQKVTVITPFTNDRKALRDGVESIKKVGGASNRAVELDHLKQIVNEYISVAKEGRLSWRDAYDQSTSAVASHVEEVIFSSRNTLAALGQISATLGGLEGKNVIIFAGAHLPERPGAELYQWLYTTFSPYMSNLTFSSEGLSGKTGSLQHYSIEDAANQASANNVTLYIIDAADTRDTQSAEITGPIDRTEQFVTFTNTAQAYQTLASISGGLALTNSENFDSVFQTLATDLNSYYSIGFKPSSRVNSTSRQIVVKMKNPEYRFRARETYVAKAPSSEDEMGSRVIANLYNADPRSTWPIDLRAGVPEKEGNQYRVPFELSFTPAITLLPQESDLVGSFTVYIVVGSDGRTSKLIKSPHPVKVPIDAEDDFRTKPMTYKAVIMMTPGENTLSVGILDQNSKNSGFAHVKVVVP